MQAKINGGFLIKIGFNTYIHDIHVTQMAAEKYILSYENDKLTTVT